MPHYIVKIAGKYMEYSTICDAIVSPPMTLEQFTEYYLWKSHLKPEHAREELADRLVRVEDRGTSCRLDKSAEDTLSGNHMYGGNDRWLDESTCAGLEPGEKVPDDSLTWDEIVAMVQDDNHPYWGKKEA